MSTGEGMGHGIRLSLNGLPGYSLTPLYYYQSTLEEALIRDWYSFELLRVAGLTESY